MTTDEGHCLRPFQVEGRYAADDQPFDKFFKPMLQRSHTFDRSAGYFSSTSLALAAEGLEPFLVNGGHIRLVVNHHLDTRDVEAVERGLAVRQAVDDTLAALPLPESEDEEKAQRFRLLATLVATGQLDIKVAVPVDSDGTPIPRDQAAGLHHSKFGVFADACDPPHRVAFEGSNNETYSGWMENYETFAAFESWDDHVWQRNGIKIVNDFERHWEGTPPAGWKMYGVPSAARDNLIAAADPEQVRQALTAQGRLAELDDVLRRIADAAGHTGDVDPLADIHTLLETPQQLAGVGIGTSGVEPWLHQHDIARKVTVAWPTSRLFADEVGLGKTIEVGLVIRELLTAGRVKRVLLLVPAAVMWQWQSELWEKFTLPIPVLNGTRLVWPNGARPNGNTEDRVRGNRWDAADVMIASSHLARRRSERTHLIDRHWDLVVVDECHHARRRGGDPKKNDPNALLRLLRAMKRERSWEGLILATATPMQMHPHEAYDLLQLCGLPDSPEDRPDAPSWRTTQAPGFVHYYAQLAEDNPRERDWKHLRNLVRSQFAAHPEPNPHLLATLDRNVADRTLQRREQSLIGKFHESFNDRPYREISANARRWLDTWLREHSPMRTLTHRNTRHLLRIYQTNGILSEDVVIPERGVNDLHVTFSAEEQELYNRIETWIRNQYAAVADAAAAGDKKAKALGFVMTVYRRRLTSSFDAITLSLERRRDALRDRHATAVALLDDDDRRAATDFDVDADVDALFDLDTDETALEVLTATADEIIEIDSFIDALNSRGEYDSKLQRLIDSLRSELGIAKPDGTQRQAIVFTQFTDTMDSLREDLAQLWKGRIACYSGRGGETHNPTTGRWDLVTKAEIKKRFTEGEFRVLLGTDAMSEGLNLQTCDLLYNLDLPWNFMRIEQRIGRIDRIGGHPKVHIINMLIDGTVEERIYTGIKDDFDDFNAVVGAAQPVLAQTELAIAAAALGPVANAEQLMVEQAQALIDAAEEMKEAPVNHEQFEHEPDAGDWRPASPLPGETPDGDADWLAHLEDTLTNHPVFGRRFTPRDDEHVWRCEDDNSDEWLVTFDRDTADESAGGIGLFVWGHPAFPDIPHVVE